VAQLEESENDTDNDRDCRNQIGECAQVHG
jgi:hypothetical protein